MVTYYIRAVGPGYKTNDALALLAPLPSTPFGTRDSSTKELWLITHLLMDHMIQRTRQGMFWKEKKVPGFAI